MECTETDERDYYRAMVGVGDFNEILTTNEKIGEMRLTHYEL